MTSGNCELLLCSICKMELLFHKQMVFFKIHILYVPFRGKTGLRHCRHSGSASFLELVVFIHLLIFSNLKFFLMCLISGCCHILIWKKIWNTEFFLQQGL